MRVAIVYDRVNKWGGAERVLLALHRLFPQAPLYTSVYNPQKAGWAEDFDVKTSFLQQFPFAKTSHEVYPLLMPLAFESFSFDEYDLVISVTSEAAKGILTKPHTKHLCYCLTPTRYLWSGYESYFPTSFQRFVSRPFVSYLRKWDKVAASRPDSFVAISKEVQQRVKTYYEKEASVVYPPVSLGLTYTPKAIEKPDARDYYLVVSRLVPYKRVDLAVKACTSLGRPLVVVGSGSEYERLKHLAGPTVRFVGSVSDDELCHYYKNAKAFLFPGYEDFGITMVEAHAFGIPVIAYKRGGALEIVKDRKTGILFAEQTEEGLVSAIKEFEKHTFSKTVISSQAKQFSETVFAKAFMSEVERLFANS